MDERRAGIGEVLRVRSFAVLLAALVTSGIGDQLARVALSLAVLERSGSLLLTSAVYAVSYLPYLVGGPVLTAVAARYRPRLVLVLCDLTRAAVVLAMALTALPVAGLLALAFVTELAAPAFDSTRSALLPDLLDDDRYVVGSSLTSTAMQLCQAGGLALGGAVVALLGTQTSLLLDALTFAASAALVRFGLPDFPASVRERTSVLSETADGLRAVFGDARLRRLVLLAWIGLGTAVVPEGLAVALADRRGTGALGLVALLAALPAGTALGAVALARLRPRTRRRMLLPLLLLVCASLLCAPLAPSTPALVALVAATGVGAAFFPLIASTVGRTVAPELRSRVFGVAGSGLMAAQGLALLGSGALAGQLGPTRALAVTGAAGLVLLVLAGGLRAGQLIGAGERVRARHARPRGARALEATG